MPLAQRSASEILTELKASSAFMEVSSMGVLLSLGSSIGSAMVLMVDCLWVGG